MVKEAQDTRRSSGTEHQCNICRQVVVVVDRGEVGRWRSDGGRDGGATKGATELRRRAQRGRNGGATVAKSACFSLTVRWRSKTGDASFVDGGAIGDGGQQRAQS
ncbi:hypothetical protein DEO72_LG8g1742 [Vigna unguiculata]|uniref:Uncharacterized protein n=1 Tax=Vigna unguiculata TaxID=3917 RepID=A0A4D6MUY9_VIGUN|nr:hypothetical protein DEO72_LG8g1740 [Vigna unguiculata]QCE03717.1 hypothetical protein DEO72_LG8g1742 [Vigna unguiculata]